MPNSSRPIGIFILGDVPPKDIVSLSRQVENAGFSELWFAEDYFMLSGFSSAAMALQATLFSRQRAHQTQVSLAIEHFNRGEFLLAVLESLQSHNTLQKCHRNFRLRNN